jgi:hypothetical protein
VNTDDLLKIIAFWTTTLDALEKMSTDGRDARAELSRRIAAIEAADRQVAEERQAKFAAMLAKLDVLGTAPNGHLQ